MTKASPPQVCTAACTRTTVGLTINATCFTQNLLLLFSKSDYYHHLDCADSASLLSIMPIQSTASRRTGRGGACVSLGCADVLKTCSKRWKEGTSAARKVSAPRQCRHCSMHGLDIKCAMRPTPTCCSSGISLLIAGCSYWLHCISSNTVPVLGRVLSSLLA